MQKKLLSADFSIVEALDALSSMAELDYQKVKNLKEAMKKGEEVSYPSKWLFLGNDELTLHHIKMTFSVLLEYLREVGEKSKEKIRLDETQKGIRAMIILLDEAAIKIDRYTTLMEDRVIERSVKELKEFQELKELYHKKLLKKLQKKDEEKELWYAGLEESLPHQGQVDEREIKDLQVVKQDHEYELFFIKREDGKRFFNRNLLRHVKLVHDFDKIIVADIEGDPFLKMEKVKDRSCQEAAKNIKQYLHAELKQFFSNNPKSLDSELYEKLASAIYSISLASSHHNLIEEGAKKSAAQYYNDFISFLSHSLVSTEYNANNELEFQQISFLEKELFAILDHCFYAFFTFPFPKENMIGLIKQLMGEKAKEARGNTSCRQIWTDFKQQGEHLHRVLEKYPSGPLFKLLDAISEEAPFGYEPLAQGFYPTALFEVKGLSQNLNVIKLPSPTVQEFIHEAKISALFQGFLEALARRNKGEKVLIINLQDRTSWKEQARCHALEAIPLQSKLKDVIHVCTLAKNTSFYHQTDEYEKIHQAEDFKKLLIMQILSGPECGFFFPRQLDIAYMKDFVPSIVQDIHQLFFGGNPVLTQKNRQDFIEITYQYLILKLVHVLKPSHLSFVCKDGVDVSPCQAAIFYGFLKIFSQDPDFSSEEKDFLLWMFHSPALSTRERAVDAKIFSRAISALDIIHGDSEVCKEKILKRMEKDFHKDLFTNLTAIEKKSAA